MSKSEGVEEFLAYVNDLDDENGCQLFHPQVTETIIRAIAHKQDFIITLDQLAEWLACRVDSVKRFLQHYTEGKDYILEYIHSGLSAGRPKEKVTLSMDCVKRLALRSRGHRAEQVRTYFIKMESQYRDYMERGIERRRKQEDPEITQSKLCRIPDSKKLTSAKPGPGIYAVQQSLKDQTKFKIGKTTDVQSRFATLRRRLPGEVELKLFEPTDDETFMESCMFTVLDESAEGHEMYNTDFPTVEKALGVCRETVSAVKRKASELGIKKKPATATNVFAFL